MKKMDNMLGSSSKSLYTRREFIGAAGILMAENAAVASASNNNAAIDTSLYISVKDFGAIGDGVFDNSGAFNKALEHANSVSNISGGDGSKGATIFVPDGCYHLPSGLSTKIKNDNITILGESSSGAMIKVGTGSVFVWENDEHIIVGGGIRSLKFIGGVGKSTAVIIHIKFGARIKFIDLEVRDIYKLAILGENAQKYASEIYFTEIFGYIANSGQALLDAKYGAGLYIDQISIYVNTVNMPKESLPHLVAPDTNFLNITSGTWDTAILSNVTTLRFFKNLNVYAKKGVSTGNIFLSNCVFDTGSKSSIEIIGGGGNITNCYFSNCWFVAMNGSGVVVSNPSGLGLIEHLHFQNCVSLLSGKHGYCFDGQYIKKVSVNHCQSIGQARVSKKPTYGIYANISEIEVIGGNHGLDGSNYLKHPQLIADYGIYLTNICTKHKVIGVDLGGRANNGAGGLLMDDFNEPSASRVIMANTSSNGEMISYAGLSEINTPKSNEKVYNKKGVNILLYINAGKVKRVIKNGFIIFTSSNVTLELSPGDWYSIVYKKAPNIIQDIKP